MKVEERIIMLLRAARKAKGYKLQDLADRIGCSAATLSRFEHGKYNIDYVYAYRRNALNGAEIITLDELLKLKEKHSDEC